MGEFDCPLLKMGREAAVEESVFSCLFSFLPKKANYGGSANPVCVKGECFVSFSEFLMANFDISFADILIKNNLQ
jgi:hypothetical protein